MRVKNILFEPIVLNLTVILFIILGACATIKPGTVDEAKVIAFERTQQLLDYADKVQTKLRESTKASNELSTTQILTINEAKILNENLQKAVDNVNLYTQLVGQWEKTGKKPAGMDLADTKAVFGLALLELQLQGEKVHVNRNKYDYNFGGYRIDSAP